MGKKSGKKRWIVVAIVIIVLIAVMIIIRLRYHPPITMVRSESSEPGIVDIAWEDEEPDEIYTVFWSNKPGIRINKPETYRHIQTVAGKRLKIKVMYDYVYFVIAKSTNKTKEFETPVIRDISFTLRNLDVRLMKRENPRTYQVNVLDNAQFYRLHYHKPDGTTFMQDINVQGLSKTLLKLQNSDDTMISISLVRDGKESDLKFLHYNEKNLYEDVKWETTTQLY